MATLQFPSVPQGSTSQWDVPLKADLTNLNADNAALAAQVSTITAGAVTIPGGVALDSFSGATDDAKLTAALTYAAAQTVKPHIFFSNRQYSFATANRAVFSGMKLSGLGGYGDMQRSANSIPNDIRFTGTGTWFVCPSGNTFDVYIGGLSFQGNKNAQFMSANPGVLWTSVIRDCGFNLWKNVLGNRATKFLVTACLFDGFWNVNNGYDTAFTLGGSDCNLWMQGCLLDSPQSITQGVDGGAFSTSGAYHLRCDYLEKTTIGPMFITADIVSGIHVLGNAANSALVFNGQGRAEGRNATTPCYGSNVRIDGGAVTFRDWEFHYGATALNTTGHTGEMGSITVTGGKVLLDGVWFDRATANAETVPFVGQSGGFVRIRNVMTGEKGATWTGKPRFHSTGGTNDVDASVTVI